jgi:hypothetical protein
MITIGRPLTIFLKEKPDREIATYYSKSIAGINLNKIPPIDNRCQKESAKPDNLFD